MGCGPSKKRVELQQNIHMRRNFNESLRNWEDDHEKDIQDAIGGIRRAAALYKNASTPEEKVLADAKIARAARVLVKTYSSKKRASRSAT
jgi:hypothetical protein